MTPLVSIIIPAHNRALALPRALASLSSQTVVDWEALVVDDGSTDGTAVEAQRCAARDPRVTVLLHGARRGAQAARNTGILASRGEWIGFLDSDDRYLPDSLERRLALAHASGNEVVHSDCLVERPGQPAQPYGLLPLEGDVYRALLAAPGPMLQGLLTRRALLLAAGPLDESLVAFHEWDTAIRLARRARFGFEAEPTFVYDCTGSDTISGDLERAARGYRAIVAAHRREILSQLGVRALSDHAAAVSGLYRAAGKRRAAWGWLVLAGLLWPFRPRALARRLGLARRAGWP